MIVTKAFVVKEIWQDTGGKQSKQWGRRYHARDAAETMARMVRQGLPADTDHDVVVREVRGDDKIEDAYCP